MKQQCVDKAFPGLHRGVVRGAARTSTSAYFYPLEENWGSGDHEMICYVSPVGGGTVTQSYRIAQPSAS